MVEGNHGNPGGEGEGKGETKADRCCAAAALPGDLSGHINANVDSTLWDRDAERDRAKLPRRRMKHRRDIQKKLIGITHFESPGDEVVIF